MTFNEAVGSKSEKTCYISRVIRNSAVQIRENDTMPTPFLRESAKIFQFQPRSALNSSERRFGVKSRTELKPAQLPTVSFGDSWYHDAAIKDADRNLKG
jgi:hypothetical protein